MDKTGFGTRTPALPLIRIGASTFAVLVTGLLALVAMLGILLVRLID